MKRSAALLVPFLFAACSRPDPGPSGRVPPSASSSPGVPGTPSAAPPNGIVLVSPYRPKRHAFKGQLHAHTTNSDGSQSAAEVMRAYRRAGYDFVAISDHNFNTPDPGVPGILFIPGVENDHGCLHENRINAVTVAPGARKPQDVIDQARREGSFVQINHPDWPGSYPKDPCWSDQALLAVSGYDAIETWNASNDWKNANAERRVDFLLTNGRRTNLTAVDDCHDVRAAYCMVASVNVFADELTVPAVMEGLKSGNYYSSSGAAISSVSVRDRTITVAVPKPSDIEFIADGGTVVKTARDATAADHAVTGVERYVRIRVTRRPGPRQAWSNPIYVTAAPGPRAGG